MYKKAIISPSPVETGYPDVPLTAYRRSGEAAACRGFWLAISASLGSENAGSCVQVGRGEGALYDV